MRKDVELTAEVQARKHGVNVFTLLGIIEVESGGEWQARRYEPLYRTLWDAEADKPFRCLFEEEQHTETLPKGFVGMDGVTTALEEYVGQKTSWGPMQVMGAVAREFGYRGKFEDLNSVQGIEYGIKVFLQLYRHHFNNHGRAGVIAAYNCGLPDPAKVPQYVQAVLHAADKYQQRA